MTSNKRTDADVLVIGSGLAGLMVALKLAEHGDVSVVLVSKGQLVESNSTYAQGGVAAVTDANAFDSPALHLDDTLKSGAGLTDPEAARAIIFGGGALIEELGKYGVVFDRQSGKYELALEGGHCQHRVLHSKDATGAAITAALSDRLKERAARAGNILLLENAYAHELCVDGERCTGALVEDKGEIIHVCAAHTVLATGGIGQIFQRTTNPSVATGDGIALAYRAGAKLIDMEFVQFHPTALAKDGAPPFLISEAVRGAGAILTDHNGKRFVQRFHEDGELATRDIVARAIHTVMHEHAMPGVNLDLRPIGNSSIKERFPTILRKCAEYGIDILNEPVPIAPAAHYFMGGIFADINGKTSVPGLYAIGECACTGLHGANRLASNSLLEAGVTAINLANHLLGPSRSAGSVGRQGSLPAAPEPYLVPKDLGLFKAYMYRYAGLVRSESGLSGLLAELDANSTSYVCDLKHAESRNMLEVGRLVAQASLLRRESRGGHFREDYGATSDAQFGGRLWFTKTGYGWTTPVIGGGSAYRQAALSA